VGKTDFLKSLSIFSSDTYRFSESSTAQLECYVYIVVLNERRTRESLALFNRGRHYCFVSFLIRRQDDVAKACIPVAATP
jgi:hypothetical protein